MLCKNIKSGNRVEITLNDNVMQSQVESVKEPNELLLRTPVLNGRLAVIPDNSEITAIIFTEHGLLNFIAHVIENLNVDGFNFLRINLLRRGERVQRRQFYRLHCSAPFFFKQVQDHNELFDIKGASTGIVQNISGGGICFVCNKDLMKNHLIKGFITINDEQALIVGKVLDGQYKFNTHAKYKMQYRVQFENLPSGVFEIIMRYILKEQREILRVKEH